MPYRACQICVLLPVFICNLSGGCKWLWTGCYGGYYEVTKSAWRIRKKLKPSPGSIFRLSIIGLRCGVSRGGKPVTARCPYTTMHLIWFGGSLEYYTDLSFSSKFYPHHLMPLLFRYRGRRPPGMWRTLPPPPSHGVWRPPFARRYKDTVKVYMKKNSWHVSRVPWSNICNV